MSFVFSLCLAVLLTGPSEAHGEGLLHAAPMFGRASAEGITFSVIAADEPVRLSLELVGRVEKEGGKRSEERDPARWSRRPFALLRGVGPVVFGAPRALPTVRGRGVEGRQLSTEEVPDGARTFDVGPGEYFECRLLGLAPGRVYRWRLRAEEIAAGRTGAALRQQDWGGRFATVRPRGSEFRFAVMADMHLFVKDLGPRITDDLPEMWLDYMLNSVEWFRQTRRRTEAEYRIVTALLASDRPDFVVGLGDHFDLHGLDFNGAFLTRTQAESAHAETRRVFSDTLLNCGAYYQLIGNWEGESGDHPDEARALAINARKRYQVNPRPDSSPLGGSAHEDYYAFRWGDALCLVLNVRGYTPKPHNLGGAGAAEGAADDYTLGEAQREFAERTLRQDDSPYKLVFIHHVIGGNAGDDDNSAYGRGGGRAARVGEQEWLHELMLETGTQVLFYGHDHVFTDIEVEGVHYTLPGTTGAYWRFDSDVTGYTEFWKQSGYGRVDVNPERLKVEFVDNSGAVIHSYEAAPNSSE